MKYLWLCVIGIVIQGVFIYVEYKKRYLPAVVLKGLASCVFILLGVLGGQGAGDALFVRLVVIGLVLGGIGDVFLNLRFLVPKHEKKVFMTGGVSFFLGHVLYLAALISRSPATLVYSIPAGLIAAVLLLIWLFKRVSAEGASRIFGIVYIGTVTLMTAVAAGLLIASPGSTCYLLYTLGAVLFTASDVVLLINLFGKAGAKTGLRVANLSLYYVGQLLIALCLQLV